MQPEATIRKFRDNLRSIASLAPCKCALCVASLGVYDQMLRDKVDTLSWVLGERP